MKTLEIREMKKAALLRQPLFTEYPGNYFQVLSILAKLRFNY